MSLIYDLFKDIVAYFKYQDEDRLVELSYPETIGISSYTRWSNPEKVHQRLREGFSMYYEYENDNFKRKRIRFINKSNQVLLLKPKEDS